MRLGAKSQTYSKRLQPAKYKAPKPISKIRPSMSVDALCSVSNFALAGLSAGTESISPGMEARIASMRGMTPNCEIEVPIIMRNTRKIAHGKLSSASARHRTNEEHNATPQTDPMKIHERLANYQSRTLPRRQCRKRILREKREENQAADPDRERQPHEITSERHNRTRTRLGQFSCGGNNFVP